MKSIFCFVIVFFYFPCVSFAGFPGTCPAAARVFAYIPDSGFYDHYNWFTSVTWDNTDGVVFGPRGFSSSYKRVIFELAWIENGLQLYGSADAGYVNGDASVSWSGGSVSVITDLTPFYEYLSSIADGVCGDPCKASMDAKIAECGGVSNVNWATWDKDNCTAQCNFDLNQNQGQPICPVP